MQGCSVACRTLFARGRRRKPERHRLGKVASDRKGPPVLKDWETFFFMLGSAGAGLIGLLFVVVTLTAGFEPSRTAYGGKFFLTPTAFHFGVVLTIGAVAIAPGLPEAATAIVIAVAALAGLAIALRSSIGIRQPPPAGVETPHWTDFWLYGLAPGRSMSALAAPASCSAWDCLWRYRHWPPSC